jgi:hypothetical protein
MRKSILSFVRSFLNDNSGQVLPWVTGMMLCFMGMAGLTIDVGHAYVAKDVLQSSSNAAALAAAGAAAINGDTVGGQAAAFGATGYNTSPYYTAGSQVVTETCLNSLMTTGSCTASSSNPDTNCHFAICNAVKVTQTGIMPTTFMGVLGIHSVPLSTTATASMVAVPWNVAIIVDGTGSMATVDSNCNGLTQFQCALSGIQAMLTSINPCPGNVSNCATSGAVMVSLFTFPNVLTSYNGTAVNSVSNDTNCGGTPATYQTPSSEPIAAPYTLPKEGAALPGAPNATYVTYTDTATTHTWNATYQVTPFVSDWYNPASSTGLNTSSTLVQAVGYGNTKGCLTYPFGIDGSGNGSGFGNTYFASVIYAAQSALVAEQAATASTRPGSQNAIIFLSDGQANASEYATSSSGYGTATANNQYSHANEFPQGPSISEVGPSSLIANTNNPAWPATPAYYTPATSTTSTVAYSTLGVNGTGKYPDWHDQCQQAIVAAQYALAHGVKDIFSIAYGAESTGCSTGWSIGLTDTTSVATGTNVGFSIPGLDPCTTMENIADSMNDFYSDPQQSGTGVNLSCTGTVNSGHQSLSDIFKAISSHFQIPKLIPNSWT